MSKSYKVIVTYIPEGFEEELKVFEKNIRDDAHILNSYRKLKYSKVKTDAIKIDDVKIDTRKLNSIAVRELIKSYNLIKAKKVAAQVQNQSAVSNTTSRATNNTEN